MVAQPAPARMQPQRLLLNAVNYCELPHDKRLVELLLQKGVPVEEVNEDGETALLAAVRLNKVEVRLPWEWR